MAIPKEHKDKVKGQYVIIEDDVEIGAGTQIWNYVHIRQGAKIGANCKIGDHVYVDREVVMGNNCKIQNSVNIYKGVVLEDSVFVGPAATFTNVRKPHADHIVPVSSYVPTIVHHGAAIGANCTIICGAEIGEDSLVAAGCTVLGNQIIPPNTIVHGFPIKNYARLRPTQ